MANYDTLPSGAITHSKWGSTKDSVGGSGGGGDNGDMEQRVAALENEFKEIRAVLGRLEPMIARTHENVTRIEATIPHLATKAEMERVRTEVQSEVVLLRSNLKSDIDLTRNDLGTALASSRAEFREGFGKLDAALARMPDKTYLWVVVSVLIAAVIAAFGLGATVAK